MSGIDLRQRLAAILAADAVGYSRLMSLDERATVATLDASRTTFHAHTVANQGRVVDTAGDSVLAVFETAAGALKAALQIQAELADAGKDIPMERRMLFRIGIHLGDVMEKADGSVYGDGVNIAARLHALAEPGQIAVSDAIHGAVRGKLSANFTDHGEQRMKNIEHPVRTYRVQLGDQAGSAPTAVAKPLAGEIDLSLPDQPSIAVLPFTNMSGEPEQEYFTDGITEDIITELSRFRSLFVIARNSSFSYKGKSVDVRTVSKELGVRHVLEGSIRRAANRIRVTAQLIDALTGKHIWAEKYDRVLEDIFAVQEEVTECIVAAIAPQITLFEVARLRKRRPIDLSAYELSVQARAMVFEAYEKADRALRDRALDLSRQALARDPSSAVGLITLSAGLLHHLLFRTTADRQSAWDEAMVAANKAIELDRMDSNGFLWKGILLWWRPNGETPWDESLSHLRRAHELNSNNSSVLINLGYCEVVAGNPRLGNEYLQRVRRLNPNDPWAFHLHLVLAIAAFHARDYEGAVFWAKQAIQGAPGLAQPHAIMARAYVGRGQLAHARASFEELKRIAPEFLDAQLAGVFTGRSAEVRQRYITFIRVAAGLEDPSAADALR